MITVLNNPEYTVARDLLLSMAGPPETETIPLTNCPGRILAEDLLAKENVPPFDRSAYDGYALRSKDTISASTGSPVMLKILEEIPAGTLPSRRITEGTAAKILTGAPIPEGADTVIPYEDTSYTDYCVFINSPAKPGDAIVRAGEDVTKGQLLARAGDRIDAGLAGTLAAQGIAAPCVWRRPCIGILSTGDEVIEIDVAPQNGKIRNSNRFMLEAAIEKAGCVPLYLGLAGDNTQRIADLIQKGIDGCDAIVMTGGVSVGDYDMTPAAIEAAGGDVLIRGVSMKPGMACAYGSVNGKLLFGLSGNPASSLTNFYAVVLPSLRKMCGCREAIPAEIRVTLASPFSKKSKMTRFLRGTLDLSDGTARMILPEEQGNAVLSSAIGCNVIALVPAGSGAPEKETILKGFLV